MSHEFGPGKYKLRGGGEAEIFAVKDDRLWGRVLPRHASSWQSVSWPMTGASCESEFDLLPPPPPERFVSLWGTPEGREMYLPSDEIPLQYGARCIGTFRLVPVEDENA